MGKEKYINILIVGYGGKSAKSLRISKRLLKFSLGAFIIGLGSLTAFAIYSYTENQKLRKEVAYLSEERTKLSKLLSEERKRNDYLEQFKLKVEELEAKLLTIDKFLRKKGIRSVPKSVGGVSSRIDPLDIDYVTFLQKEAVKFQKYLSRLPLGPPVWGRLTSKYGYRRDPFSGKYEFHDGVDIMAPWGTPVRATAEGKVVFAGRWGGYGKTVIIKHAYGFKTLYAHMSKIKVKRGQWVKSGQIIGYVGSSGKSTGPHVHYEVWRYSKKQNPIKYMYVRW